MGRDNPPKHRQKKNLERKLNQRASYDRILIVSEGTKTEPNYFEEIRGNHRLNTANIRILPSAFGTEPIDIVKYAQELFENGNPHTGIQRRAFEQVYAVFDRDKHLTYRDALKKAESLDHKLRNDNKQRIIFKAVPSIPSFELWLLLHYEDIQAPISSAEALQRLKKEKCIPHYVKGAANIFKHTYEHLDIAVARARALAKKFNPYNDPQPYTGIVDLVTLLIHLKEK